MQKRAMANAEVRTVADLEVMEELLQPQPKN